MVQKTRKLERGCASGHANVEDHFAPGVIGDNALLRPPGTVFAPPGRSLGLKISHNFDE